MQRKVAANTGTGNIGLQVEVGFEPGWLLLKNASQSSSDWRIMDNERLSGDNSNSLRPNRESNESSGLIKFTSSGFEITTSASIDYNSVGDTFIYVAIAKDATSTPETELTLTDSNTYNNADGSDMGQPISETFTKGQTVKGESTSGTYGAPTACI